MKLALQKTKLITALIRDKWAKKDEEFSLLDIQGMINFKKAHLKPSSDFV